MIIIDLKNFWIFRVSSSKSIIQTPTKWCLCSMEHLWWNSVYEVEKILPRATRRLNAETSMRDSRVLFERWVNRKLRWAKVYQLFSSRKFCRPTRRDCRPVICRGENSECAFFGPRHRGDSMTRFTGVNRSSLTPVISAELGCPCIYYTFVLLTIMLKGLIFYVIDRSRE